MPTINRIVRLVQGVAGPSAYQSYLNTTSDDPPLSEEAWVESLKANVTYANGIASLTVDGTPIYFPASPTNPNP